MSSHFLRYCYPALGGMLRKVVYFSKRKLTLLVGKGPTFRLYAGALIERCFNAVLATHKGLIMPAEAVIIFSVVGPGNSSQGIFHMRDKYRKQHSHFQACQCSSLWSTCGLGQITAR